MSTITLQPAGNTVTSSLGTLSGVWFADGVNNPAGTYAWLKHSNGAANLQWRLANVTNGGWLIVNQDYTAAAWDASPAPVDSGGFKLIALEFAPTWPTPVLGDEIVVQLSAPSRWQTKTGTVEGGEYVLIAPEPEAWGGLAFGVACIIAGRFFSTRRR